tara:strand:+ start:383 stop:907 length:525 start_codon:yes stop_codon:yes gene_type:complete
MQVQKNVPAVKPDPVPVRTAAKVLKVVSKLAPMPPVSASSLWWMQMPDLVASPEKVAHVPAKMEALGPKFAMRAAPVSMPAFAVTPFYKMAACRVYQVPPSDVCVKTDAGVHKPVWKRAIPSAHASASFPMPGYQPPVCPVAASRVSVKMARPERKSVMKREVRSATACVKRWW